jgi:hypothetical protein
VDCAEGLSWGCVYGLGKIVGDIEYQLFKHWNNNTYENDGCTAKGLGGHEGWLDSVLDNHPYIEDIANYLSEIKHIRLIRAPSSQTQYPSNFYGEPGGCGNADCLLRK